MILQLNPIIPLETPLGKGWAHFMICDSMESHLYWVVFLDDTGEIFTFANPYVRADKNITLERFKGNEKWNEISKEWGKMKSTPKPKNSSET